MNQTWAKKLYRSVFLKLLLLGVLWEQPLRLLVHSQTLRFNSESLVAAVIPR